MLDELPSLEIAATAVALVLVRRAYLLSQGGPGVWRRRGRAESARARDLIGVVLLAGAALYALRVQRASTWFLVASGVAVLAQLLGFYFRTAALKRASAGPSIEVSEHGPALRDADGDVDDDGYGDFDEQLYACPNCGHGTLIELDDTARLLGGLSQLTTVTASVCPHCGALSGHVDDPAQIPIGPEHGTTLRQSPSGDDEEALEEPAEHDG